MEGSKMLESDLSIAVFAPAKREKFEEYNLNNKMKFKNVKRFIEIRWGCLSIVSESFFELYPNILNFIKNEITNAINIITPVNINALAWFSNQICISLYLTKNI